MTLSPHDGRLTHVVAPSDLAMELATGPGDHFPARVPHPHLDRTTASLSGPRTLGSNPASGRNDSPRLTSSAFTVAQSMEASGMR